MCVHLLDSVHHLVLDKGNNTATETAPRHPNATLLANDLSDDVNKSVDGRYRDLKVVPHRNVGLRHKLAHLDNISLLQSGHNHETGLFAFKPRQSAWGTNQGNYG